MSDESAGQGGEMSSVEKTTSAGPGEEHYKKFEVGSQIEQPTLQTEVPDIRMQVDPSGSQGPKGPDFQPPGEPLPSPERGETPEAIRTQYRELYTVEGADFITEIKEATDAADIKRIRRVTESSVGFMEGLYFGIEGDNYNLDDDIVAGELMDMFTDVESSTDRPSYGQVFYALRHGLTESVRDADRFNRYKKKGEEGLDKWRLQLARKRKREWDIFSQNRVDRGLPGLGDKEMAKKIEEDVNNQEAKVSGWLEHKGELIGLKHHLDARVLIFDQCFSQRQRACEVDANQVELTGKGIKPDKGSWMGYYWGNRTKEIWKEKGISEWGDKVSHVEDVIEGVAKGVVPIPGIQDDTDEDFYVKDIYVNGFRNVGEFKAWIKVLLEESKINGETRMDVVWNAWKMSLWKENITKLAWRVNEEGKYQFGTPPFSSDLMTKMIHNDKARMKESGNTGFDRNGNNVDLDEWIVLDERGKKKGNLSERDFEDYIKNLERTKPYRSISHAGHPMSIGRVGRLVDEYESHTEVDNLHKWKDEETKDVSKKVSLREFARRGISRGGRDFPWEDTQLRQPGQPVGEAPSGSVGGWFLNRLRGNDVRNDHLRIIPDPRKLTIEFFEDSTVRKWEKLGKLNPGPLEDGVPQNPFAWYLAGVLRARSLADEKSNYTKGERSYRSDDLQNKTTSWPKENVAASGTIADSDILRNALRIGAISSEEKEWIEKHIVLEAKNRRSQAY